MRRRVGHLRGHLEDAGGEVVGALEALAHLLDLADRAGVEPDPGDAQTVAELEDVIFLTAKSTVDDRLRGLALRGELVEVSRPVEVVNRGDAAGVRVGP